ncbi:MAG TPA: class I SAM-dependent methyltransferase [Terriglobia bacterium]|nr:class I SAM-dependent methyltransferase [Terriglobia bacterium]
MFENHQIEGALWERWGREIRRVELDMMMRHVPLGKSATVLELGCGEGFQLGLLRKRFDRAFAIDPERRPESAPGFACSAAEALPFPDEFFDLVFSCCVLEHVASRPRTIEEAVRVLRPGGYMAHALPGRTWKASSVLLNPVAYPLHVLGKWSALRHSGAQQESAEDASIRFSRPGIRRVLHRYFYPEIHGTFSSHWTEYVSWGRKQWTKALSHPELTRVAEVPLLSYGAFGLLRFRGMGARVWLARHGLAGSWALILRKAG